MPFKSKAQRRKFAELLVNGKITDEAYERWNQTTGRKELPERVHPEAKPGKKRTAKTTTKKRIAKKTTRKRTTATKAKRTTRTTTRAAAPGSRSRAARPGSAGRAKASRGAARRGKAATR